ncbi:MAG: phosphate signaling complex protein PhoU [Blastocatellia bacterium]|nr:phosphate signaling complex protein PhoU [Blastocatellia bacterium]
MDVDLDRLRDKILILGGQAETALLQATKALIHRDSVLAQQVIADDDDIDYVESEIDQLCVDLLRDKCPVSEDLRFIFGIARTAPIIERIADHAVNIARHALKLNDEPQLKPYVELPRMAELVHQMLVESLDALTQRDAAKAYKIIRRDPEVDRLYGRIFDELLLFMTQDSSAVVRSVELLFVVKHFERIADYVTNICEQVVFIVEGRIIKHTKEPWEIHP